MSLCVFHYFTWNSIFGCKIFLSTVQSTLCWCFLYYTEFVALLHTDLCTAHMCACVNRFVLLMGVSLCVRAKWFEQIRWSTFHKSNWKELNEKYRNIWAHKIAPFLVKNWKHTNAHTRYTYAWHLCLNCTHLELKSLIY